MGGEGGEGGWERLGNISLTRPKSLSVFLNQVQRNIQRSRKIKKLTNEHTKPNRFLNIRTYSRAWPWDAHIYFFEFRLVRFVIYLCCYWSEVMILLLVYKTTEFHSYRKVARIRADI